MQQPCALVGVGVVVVVLDPPGLKGVDEGGKGNGAHNVLQEFVCGEAAVATIVPNNKELQQEGHRGIGEAACSHPKSRWCRHHSR